MALIVAMPHAPLTNASGWLARQSHPDIHFSHLVNEALLIVDPNRPGVNSSLWSLTWEMWFSLLLPLAVVIALMSRRAPVASAVLLCAVSGFGYVTGNPAAMFLPAFGLGALLGANAHRIQSRLNRWQSRRHATAVWVAVAAAGPTLAISYWLLRPVLGSPFSQIALALRVPGAVIMVATVAFWPAAARVFEMKALAFLGRVSFSLYLVQAPIVIGLGLAFSGRRWWVGAVLTLVACSVATLLMYRLVERPSQRLGSWVGRGASRLWAALTPREDALQSLQRPPVWMPATVIQR